MKIYGAVYAAPLLRHQCMKTDWVKRSAVFFGYLLED